MKEYILSFQICLTWSYAHHRHDRSGGFPQSTVHTQLWLCWGWGVFWGGCEGSGMETEWESERNQAAGHGLGQAGQPLHHQAGARVKSQHYRAELPWPGEREGSRPGSGCDHCESCVQSPAPESHTAWPRAGAEPEPVPEPEPWHHNRSPSSSHSNIQTSARRGTMGALQNVTLDCEFRNNWGKKVIFDIWFFCLWIWLTIRHIMMDNDGLQEMENNQDWSKLGSGKRITRVEGNLGVWQSCAGLVCNFVCPGDQIETTRGQGDKLNLFCTYFIYWMWNWKSNLRRAP